MVNVLKYLYSFKSVKGKILYIIDDLKNIVGLFYKGKFWIEWYGAYDIDPKNLVIWICVKTDEAKFMLESNHELMLILKNTLVKFNYPEQARSSVYIGFESQETVDRESKGNWYVHFK